ncbi:MAG: hypothetical protein CVT48_02340 [Thermoplasmata archaeon HGW-Thermoplasmata-1]|nr:MAG: hypothetical protein CVT48_02340 [Thermoplasmata archaeon HGW-Thermoplasmata-1]
MVDARMTSKRDKEDNMNTTGLTILLAFAMVCGTLGAFTATAAEQPSPQKDTLWIHANLDEDPQLWMNTDGSDGKDAGMLALECYPDDPTVELDCPLGPESLATSLEFDSAGKVTVVVWLSVGYFFGAIPDSGPMLDAEVEATLTAGSKVIGSGTGTGTLTLASYDDKAEITIEFTPQIGSVSEADGNLNLHIKITYSQGGALPGITIGGLFCTGGKGSETPSRVELPLKEIQIVDDDTDEEPGDDSGDGNDTGGDDVPQDTKKTPGFEIIAAIGAIGSMLIVFRRRK